jgi:RecB family exonuclease
VVEAPAATRGESPSVEDVSFSALKGYLTCPRRFWSERVVRLGWAPVALEELPASDDGGDDEAASMADDPLAFGSAVHGALEEAVEGREPTDERLTVIAAMFGLSEDARGRLARAVGAALGSAAVERARQTGRMRAEVPFSLALGEGEAAVRLGGSIDLYARNEETAVIIDYKTGTWGDSDGVRRSYELQAQCYALAALADGVKSVEALYVRPEVADGHDVETTTFGPFDQSHIPRLESTILEVVGRIRSGEFPPNPSERACSECAIPRGLCPEAWESN